MNIDPVLIDDDDVDMEPVVILDEDDINTLSEKAVSVPNVPTVETIVLDDESPEVTRETVKKKIKKPTSSKSKITLAIHRKNNRLIDKIVNTCITMENATGMKRVVYKTVLPLYRDTNIAFKESKEFRYLLKKTYKLLTRDPDHKFLHIKTLCEELKSGGLRRNVPFVTLAKNLKKTGSQWNRTEFTSSSRKINQNLAVNKQTQNVYTNKNEKHRIETHAEMEKTDIIDLDDSETESVSADGSENDDGQNDVIIIEETEPSVQGSDSVITVPQEVESKKGNQFVQETLEVDSNKEDKVVQKTIEGDSNKENNDESGKSSDNEMDYELLIPKNHVRVLPKNDDGPSISNTDIEKIARLEKRIAYYKRMIDKLEETEVLTENPFASPYNLCSKYKENVVKCYRHICELKGYCNDIVKRHELRLTVAEGHPPGPAKRLEEFLNSTIDRTGAVEFPDFSDVLKCVVESNNSDNLAWNRQQVVQEALALFRHCGHALRAQRQKREYRDLLSLIRNNQDIDDPAEKDPILLAQLEENKRIAKIKEEQILERYVIMEVNSIRRAGISQGGNAGEFESDQETSGSDSESEENITLPSNITTSTGNNQPNTGECSWSNIDLNLLRTNNFILTSTFRNNQCDTGQSSNTNNVTVNNLTANPLILSPTFINKQCDTGQSSNTNNVTVNNLTANPLISSPTFRNNQCDTGQSSDTNNVTVNNLTATPLILSPTFRNNQYDTVHSSNTNAVPVNNLTANPFLTSTFRNNQYDTVHNSNTNAVPVNNLTANPFLNSTFRNNQCDIEQSSDTNNVTVNNLTANPMLLGLLIVPNKTLNQVVGTPPTIQPGASHGNQCSTRESSIINNGFSTNYLVMLPPKSSDVTPNTMHNEFATVSANKEQVDVSNNGFNNTTINKNSDMSSINNMRNVNNTEIPAGNEPRNVQDNVTSTTDGVEQNCDSSISNADVEQKSEDVVKIEPLDIQSMLDELGDDFVCQVIDIEDPFLVIDISSDSSSDDDDS